MADQQEMVNLLSKKLGSRMDAAVKAKADVAPAVGNMRLPAGIENGVAHLKVCQIQEIKEGSANAGKLILYCQARAVFPETFKGAPVAGKMTSFTIGLYDDPTRSQRKTLEEQTQYAIEMMKSWGVPPDIFKQGIAGIAAACTWLVNKKPHIEFRTWKGSKQEIQQCPDGKFRLFRIDDNGKATPSANIGAWPTEEAAKAANKWVGRDARVTEEWGSKCNWTPPANSGVVNTTGPATNGTQVPASIQARSQSVQVDKPEPTDDDEDTTPDEDTSEPVEEFSEFTELELLVQRADSEDEDDAEKARDELTALALKAGLTQEFVDASNGWDEVAQAIKSNGGQPSTEVVEEVKPQFIPVKGKTVLYTPPGKNPKTKKPYKEQECKVISVDSKKSEAKIKSLDDSKEYTVQFSDLKPNT